MSVEFNFIDFISSTMEKAPLTENMLEEITKELGMEILLNVILVHRNIRPAMLFQPIDYGEDNRNLFNISGEILKKVQVYFPDLILSSEYENYQGVIISKQSFNDRKDISSEEMGMILGYPCYAGFLELHCNLNSRDYFGVDVSAELQNGTSIQLYGCLCDNFATFEQEFEKFAETATEVFHTHYAWLKVKKVVVVPKKISTVKTILEKLVKDNGELDLADIAQILSIFHNCDFNVLDKEFLQYYQPDNPIHRGLLIGFILNDKHNLLSPFFPMSPTSDEYKLVRQISANWEQDLLLMLFQTAK